jgi:hypothetical protein
MGLENRTNQLKDGLRKLTAKTFGSGLNTRVARFFLVQHTKNAKNLPNSHKNYQMIKECTKWQ